MKAYLVCATQRSGSTLLCELLKSSGVAGRPEEYFEARARTGLPPHPGDYLSDLPRTGAGIRDDATPAHAPEHSSLIGLASYREHLERTFRLGTTPNGVFGTKIMWGHLAELRALAGELPEYRGLGVGALLERLFDGPRYVWVTRRDKVRQAISLWRALQTRSWRMDGDPDGRRAPQYRFDGIDHLIERLESEDRQWQEFFDHHRLPVLRVGYEDDLEADREGTLRAVLEHVGVAPPLGWSAGEVMQRQADSLSEEWVAAYRRDAAERELRTGAASQ